MAKGRRASVHPSKPKNTDKISTVSSLTTDKININDETATLTSSIMSGGLTQSGNFFNDFKSFVQEFSAPSYLLKIVDKSSSASTETEVTENNTNNEEYGTTWTSGPCIITIGS